MGDRPAVFPEGLSQEVVKPRDSATVIVARDGERGLEVFMLERHLASDFLGGAYVFPGGTVDERDRDPALAQHTDGLPKEVDEAYGAEPSRGIGFPICAIRETFEEAGILLARTADGRPARMDGADRERFAEARRAFNARELGALDFATRDGIRFAADHLHYWQRLVTPEFAPKRYDARFFVAAMPEGQEPIHDERETTASVWVRPEDALERAKDGKLVIIFPTRKTLESIAPYPTTPELIAAAKSRTPEPILPTVTLRDGRVKILLPGDPTEHDP